MRIAITGLLSLAWVAALGLGVSQAAEPKDAKPATQPYPLTTCVVSGEKLGDMGEQASIQYQGREVRFCCTGCIDDFKKDPAKYLAKLDAARKAASTQPATQPAAEH